jgi:hypothetical protein
LKITSLQFVLCLAAAVSALAQPLPFDSTPLAHLAQDGTGRVWAAGKEPALMSWAAGHWERVRVRLPGGPETARPVALQTNYQGDIYAVWSRNGEFLASEDQYWITRVHGSSEPVSASFRAWLTTANLAFEPGGTGWLTDAGPRIYRIGPDLAVDLAFTGSPDQIWLGPGSTSTLLCA